MSNLRKCALLLIMLLMLALQGCTTSAQRAEETAAAANTAAAAAGTATAAEIASRTPTATSTATPLPPTETPTPVPPTPTATPEPVCGAPPVTYLLGVGIDYRPNSYVYGLADVIRIVRLDYVNKKVSVLAMLRSLEVELPDVVDPNLKRSLLNQAYFYGVPPMDKYEGPAGGAGLLARTLKANFDIQVDNYIVVNMSTFRRFVSYIGGIYVYVPNNLYPQFPAGNTFMGGYDALLYSRLRMNDNLFGRQLRQNQIMLAIGNQLQSDKWNTRLADLIEVFDGRVLTDLTPEQFAQMACLGLMITPEDVSFAQFDEDLFHTERNESGQFVSRADYDLLRQMIADFMAGRWPEQGLP